MYKPRFIRVWGVLFLIMFRGLVVLGRREGCVYSIFPKVRSQLFFKNVSCALIQKHFQCILLYAKSKQQNSMYTRLHFGSWETMCMGARARGWFVWTVPEATRGAGGRSWCSRIQEAACLLLSTLEQFATLRENMFILRFTVVCICLRLHRKKIGQGTPN